MIDYIVNDSFYVQEYSEDNEEPDFDYDSGFLFFLHDFGEILISTNPLPDIFALEVNGTSFVAVLFGSGFLVYCGWVLLKWII